MKVSIKWLKDYVDIDLTPAGLADVLTMAGSEVKGIQVIGGSWEKVVIGKITAVNPHPNADRLRLATIDLGSEQHTVVCGAPNLNIGDKVAFAHVGAQLMDGHSGELSRLKPARIRGVASNGMACSEKELGISDSHEGIMILPAEAPVGVPLADFLGDAVLDLDITPNRPDCLSVIGLAREIAALTGKSLHLPEIGYEESAVPIEEKISVEVAAPDLCPRYCASLVTGVKVAESPRWMQQRLLVCGMRPISNVVDVTNYVMLEYGQPLHSFDYEQIRGKKIIVRRAADGEEIVTLDGTERILTGDMLVIADEKRAVAVAGVMGGANTEVIEYTKSILLEAANFNPASIHYTGRALHLPSEACMRFERGIRPELAPLALRRATQLLVQLGGGEVARGIADAYPGRKEQQHVLLTTGMVKRVLGIEFDIERIEKALKSLGFECQRAERESGVRATAPYWRSDINQAVDLVEEVARFVGYDKIPTTMLGDPLPRQNPHPIVKLRQVVGRCLTGYGFQEIMTYSLTGLEVLNKLYPATGKIETQPLRMANPMTADQEYLRPNLRANLLTALSANRRHEDGGIRLFELGKVYIPRDKDLPDERDMVCGVMGGLRQEESWQSGNELIDFFDARGVVEGLLARAGVEAGFEDYNDESLYPNKQAAVVIGGSRLGVIGELHPQVAGAFEITGPAYMFEIDLTALLPLTVKHGMFQPVPRFPAVVRDIALVVDAGIRHKRVKDIIRGFSLVARVGIFDVYSGEQLPPGKKSLAYKITFQSTAHTLTDEEVNEVLKQILDRLSGELGAALRG